MGRVYQYDNRVDTTYVYEVEDVIDSTTGVMRSKRKLIGKLDPETREVIPTAKRGRPRKTDTGNSEPTVHVDREEQAKAHFLETIRKKDDLISSLKKENNRLKESVMKLEKTLSAISSLCGRIQQPANNNNQNLK